MILVLLDIAIITYMFKIIKNFIFFKKSSITPLKYLVYMVSSDFNFYKSLILIKNKEAFFSLKNIKNSIIIESIIVGNFLLFFYDFKGFNIVSNYGLNNTNYFKNIYIGCVLAPSLPFLFILDNIDSYKNLAYSSEYSYFRFLRHFIVYDNYYTFYGKYLSFRNKYNLTWNSYNSFLNGLEIFNIPKLDIKSISNYSVILNNSIVWYKSFRSLILPVIICLLVFFICIEFFYVNLARQLGIWVIVLMLFFWLISGFNFFLKKYRYGKFTSAVLRFWKRTNSVFWLIEGFLFGLFFYYYLNSSQEPLYFYDTSSLNQDYLISLINVYTSYLLLVFLIIYSYNVMLRLPQLTSRQNILHITIISLIYIYIFLLESYQFYYIITLFFENVWNFNIDVNLWELSSENPRIRVKQQYLIVALIAKYWHFLFIFISWLFFIFKCYEQKKIYYTQFGLNIQNLLILFGLNIVFIAQWFKWIIRRYYDIVYFWFFTDTNMFTLKLFYTELFLLVRSAADNLVSSCNYYLLENINYNSRVFSCSMII